MKKKRQINWDAEEAWKVSSGKKMSIEKNYGEGGQRDINGLRWR